MCPGDNESAGKHKSGKTRKGSKWLLGTLVECASAAARSKDTYLAARYARLKGRRGHPKAIVAVGHSILVVVYHLLVNGQPYTDLGAAHFLERHGTESYKRRLVANLSRLPEGDFRPRSSPRDLTLELTLTTRRKPQTPRTEGQRTPPSTTTTLPVTKLEASEAR
jgi:hypothetical protein